MKVITAHLPEAYLDAIDRLIEAGLYPNRAEAIRSAVRDLIKREAPVAEEILSMKNGGQKNRAIWYDCGV